MTAQEVLWERDAHTKAKHELLLAFFNKWVTQALTRGIEIRGGARKAETLGVCGGFL
jgi:hypothetical protein